MNEIKNLRQQLDALDFEICSLLSQRMNVVDAIGDIKRDRQLNLKDQRREEMVLKHVEAVVQHPVLKESIANIYKVIMDESKIAQRFLRCSSFPFSKIGVIGLGLIGGSICKAIKVKKASATIGTLASASPDNILAFQERWVDKEYASLKELMLNCELLILAAPLSAILPLAEEIGSQRDGIEKLVVIDVGSVKKEIVHAFESLSDEHLEFVGTHPMSGKETSGFANSQATLFVSHPWVIVPHLRNNPGTISAIIDFIQFLGAEPMGLDASKHDRRAALISHLPGMLSQAFLDFASSKDEEALQMAGPGFKSFTRLAHSNPEMRKQINESNKNEIQHYLREWIIELLKIN
jgi:prephenate dehydrogenase